MEGVLEDVRDDHEGEERRQEDEVEEVDEDELY